MNNRMTKLIVATVLAIVVASVHADEPAESWGGGFYTPHWEGYSMATVAQPLTPTDVQLPMYSRVRMSYRATPKLAAQNLLWLNGLAGTHQYEGQLNSAAGDPTPIQLTIACAKETTVAMRCVRVRDVASGVTDVDFVPERMWITYDRSMNQMSYQANDGEGRRDVVTSRVHRDGSAEFRESCPEHLGSRCKRIIRIQVGPDGLSQSVEIRVKGKTVGAVEIAHDDQH